MHQNEFAMDMELQKVVESIRTHQHIPAREKQVKKKDKVKTGEESEWQKRMKNREEIWELKRDSVHEHFISFQAFSGGCCQECRSNTDFFGAMFNL